MCVLSDYVKQTLANAMNRRMCAEEHLSPFAAPVHNAKTRSLKLLRSFPEVVNYLLKNYETDQAITKNDAAVLCYMKHPI